MVSQYKALKTATKCLLLFLVTGSCIAQSSGASVISKFEHFAALALHSPQNGHVFAAGAHGGVAYSQDFGKKWAQLLTPTKATLTDLYFDDLSSGLAVGHDATIIRTSDGGKSWKIVHFKPELEQPLMRVTRLSNGTYIAVGAYGLYLESNDAITWNSRQIPSLENPDIGAGHFYDIVISGSGSDIVAVGEFGLIGTSVDSGKNWRLIQTDYEGSFFTICSNERQTAVAGMRGNLFIKQTGTNTFNKMDIGDISVSLFACVYAADGKLHLFGQQGSHVTVSPYGAELYSYGAFSILDALYDIKSGWLLATTNGFHVVK